MFLTLQNVKSNLPIDLATPIDNRNADLGVILHEAFYTVKWFNISKDLKNNWVTIITTTGDKRRKLYTAPDGYYDFCHLADVLFKPHFDAKLDPTNLKVNFSFDSTQHSNIEAVELAPKLASILGFKSNTLNVKEFLTTGKIHFYGDDTLDLSIPQRLYLYLKQLSTCENIVDGKQSTLLKIFPIQKASYCETVLVIPSIQRRKLSREYLTSLCFEIKDQNNSPVEFDGLTLILEIN